MKKNRKTMQKTIMLLIFCFMFSLFTYSVSAKAKTKNTVNLDKDYLKVLKWRSIGPHRGGRVIAVAGHPTEEKTFYFGGTGGGVWKTTDGGETWNNVSDGFFKTSSVGAIAVSDSSSNVIYVGMGECCLRGNISHGDGVYKSTDSGKTWKHVGLTDTRHIASIYIHPQNSDLVYVAALGHAFGPNKARGLYCSKDGGKTWKKILYKNEKAGAIDMAVNPRNPNEMFVAFWEVQRSPWGFNSGGPGSGLYKTLDGGKTWKEITHNTGLPKGIKGRIGLSVSAAKPNRIWALVEAKDKGLYLSEDSGENWKKVSSKPELMQRPWYYTHVKADTKDPDTLYVMNVGFWKSTDSGKTFKRIRTPHGDNHDLWIDSQNPLRMIEGNDGGATVTFDGGKNWSSIYNQPTAQFYHVTTDNRFPYRVYGAQQDNSTICVPSRSEKGQIGKDEWYEVGGCESGYIAVHPENPDIVYAGCYGGMLTRYDHKLDRTWDISVWPDTPMGAGAKDLKYRFQWTFPIHISPHDPNVLYTAANQVFRSYTEGRSWEVISPDLTRNDKSKMESSGGPLTKDNTSVEYYGTIFSLVESPVQKDLLWAGSDDGLMFITQDGGKNWDEITPKNLPEWSLISIIEPSNFEPGTAYMAATRYKLDDYKPYLYKTNDFGKTWKRINNGIPVNEFTRVIREDPKHPGYLYAGTEAGLYFSKNDGKTWQDIKLNLPVTPIHDLVIHENDLVVGTHGRSFWILDDLTLLYQAINQQSREAVTLFQPRETKRFMGRYREKVVNAGQTLPNGVILNYYIKEEPKEPVTLTFMEEDGTLIRTYSSKPEEKEDPKVKAKAGMNQFVWDLSYPASNKIKKAIFWGPSAIEPMAIPGNYKVKLKTGDQETEKSFTIVRDPRFNVTQKQYQEQFNLVVKIRDRLTDTHDAINEIRNIDKQIQWYLEQTKEESYFKKLEDAAKALQKKLDAVEGELVQKKAKAFQDLLNYPIKLNNKLATLGGWVIQYSEDAPTQQAKDLFKDLSQRVDVQLKKLQILIDEDVSSFNKLIKDLSVPAIMLKHIKKEENNENKTKNTKNENKEKKDKMGKTS
jgi:photosystem II stability/assembly factor-like uncharacterized protein